jgi:hypothetical protein
VGRRNLLALPALEPVVSPVTAKASTHSFQDFLASDTAKQILGRPGFLP